MGVVHAVGFGRSRLVGPDACGFAAPCWGSGQVRKLVGVEYTLVGVFSVRVDAVGARTGELAVDYRRQARAGELRPQGQRSQVPGGVRKAAVSAVWDSCSDGVGFGRRMRKRCRCGERRCWVRFLSW